MTNNNDLRAGRFVMENPDCCRTGTKGETLVQIPLDRLLAFTEAECQRAREEGTEGVIAEMLGWTVLEIVKIEEEEAKLSEAQKRNKGIMEYHHGYIHGLKNLRSKFLTPKAK